LPSGWEIGQDWPQYRIFVVNPRRSSTPFVTNAWSISLARKDALEATGGWDLESYLYEQSGPNGQVTPWLLGRVLYSDTFGRRYHTSFCIRAYRDGEYAEDGDPPYNERT
jgi:hypothetical protein